MVIVTTAVYWGLTSQLRTQKFYLVLLTFQHRAGVSPYTASYDFARTCVFSKQSLLPGLCGPQSSHSSGPPSPEVTGAFCRVPYQRFFRTPRYSLPDHLSWFRVRATVIVTPGLFSTVQDHSPTPLRDPHHVSPFTAQHYPDRAARLDGLFH